MEVFRTLRAVIACAIAISSTQLFPVGPARACGGMFCGQPAGPMQAPAPVDQSGERIIFDVGEGEVCASVWIDYVGTADEFAWIVPVPDTPEIEEADPNRFMRLLQQSQMAVRTPGVDRTTCPSPSGGVSDEAGCGCSDSVNESGDSGSDAGSGGGGGGARPPVQVTGRTVTDNYEATSLLAETSDDLVEWLQENRYNVSDNMVPVMRPYVDDGMQFVAVKLRDGRATDNIRPITMCYPGETPMIPIRMTAVAAQPYMSITALVVADTPFSPGNFMTTAPDTEALVYDANGSINYFEWVARAVAEADGRLFVREYVGPTGEGSGVLSRWYTRLGPEHMTEDPLFVAAAASLNTGTQLVDLSARTPILDCFGGPIADRQPNACGWNYCGRDAECTLTEAVAAACACPDDTLAAPVPGPDGTSRVSCVPAENPFTITAQAAGDGTELSPCAAYDCGLGTCRTKGGFPMCDCDVGAVAAFDAGGLVRCVDRFDEAGYGPGGGREAMPAVDMMAVRARHEAELRASEELRRRHRTSRVAFAALAVLGFGWGRRRRRGRRAD